MFRAVVNYIEELRADGESFPIKRNRGKTLFIDDFAKYNKKKYYKSKCNIKKLKNERVQLVKIVT